MKSTQSNPTQPKAMGNHASGERGRHVVLFNHVGPTGNVTDVITVSIDVETSGEWCRVSIGSKRTRVSRDNITDALETLRDSPTSVVQVLPWLCMSVKMLDATPRPMYTIGAESPFRDSIKGDYVAGTTQIEKVLGDSIDVDIETWRASVAANLRVHAPGPSVSKMVSTSVPPPLSPLPPAFPKAVLGDNTGGAGGAGGASGAGGAGGIAMRTPLKHPAGAVGGAGAGTEMKTERGSVSRSVFVSPSGKKVEGLTPSQVSFIEDASNRQVGLQNINALATADPLVVRSLAQAFEEEEEEERVVSLSPDTIQRNQAIIDAAQQSARARIRARVEALQIKSAATPKGREKFLLNFDEVLLPFPGVRWEGVPTRSGQTEMSAVFGAADKDPIHLLVLSVLQQKGSFEEVVVAAVKGKPRLQPLVVKFFLLEGEGESKDGGKSVSDIVYASHLSSLATTEDTQCPHFVRTFPSFLSTQNGEDYVCLPMERGVGTLGSALHAVSTQLTALAAFTWPMLLSMFTQTVFTEIFMGRNCLPMDNHLENWVVVPDEARTVRYTVGGVTLDMHTFGLTVKVVDAGSHDDWVKPATTLTHAEFVSSGHGYSKWPGPFCFAVVESVSRLKGTSLGPEVLAPLSALVTSLQACTGSSVHSGVAEATFGCLARAWEDARATFHLEPCFAAGPSKTYTLPLDRA